jgi:hypothetical protein
MHNTAERTERIQQGKEAIQQKRGENLTIPKYLDFIDYYYEEEITVSSGNMGYKIII